LGAGLARGGQSKQGDTYSTEKKKLIKIGIALENETWINQIFPEKL